ncbi:BgTH12-05126 [Blumeria graminis f. sp. triticale]|uniref:BgtE-10136 n=3 Tax=Blumeria graminis TaxID=34373 RepID=A0A061HKJ1_BLUGR|nr:putative secreted effector protein [Blumeria graminis f. sp. tritici 96224]CAD6502535.1 BgTH12-05126 [Blumeria graminis f. sp. triticale]VDB87918.1 BgtE-10136 [Blumeria graminis f. sp. tritici]
MHCHFLVISSLLESRIGDTFQFNIIKPFQEGSTGHYIRYEGPPYWSFETPPDVTCAKLSNISKNHIIYKFCAEREADLSSLEKPFEDTTYRKNEKIRGTLEEDQLYKECSRQIHNQNFGITLLNVSAISKNRIPPCTVQMIIWDISHRRARAYGPYGNYSHKSSAKVSLNWDLLIPFHEFLDRKDPLMTTEVLGELTHLVHVAGFLKLVTRKSLEKAYKISPALGNPPGNEIYEFLENSHNFKIIPPLEVDVTR